MIKSKQVRDLTFFLHRYLGLVVGLVLIIVGLTGSLLVFQHEIDQFLVSQQFGTVTPGGDAYGNPKWERISVESALETVKTVYANQPGFKLSSITTLPDPHLPYRAWLEVPGDKYLQVLVNPYTGKIMGSQQWDQTLIGLTFKLHYQLLAGDTGTIIVGIVAFMLLALSITGIVLWPGWRKLISGFKIKWNAHPKRVNFDIHKVSGIIAAVFLSMIAFTGFCWNFYEFAKPAIHVATFTPIVPEPVSKPIPNKSALGLSEILQKADAALPGAATTFISLPQKPEEVFRVGKKQPQETSDYGYSRIYLDQYTGEVVQLQNGMKPTRAEAVLNSFTPLHYGTFWGLPSRIFYVFVGLTPLILFVTGFVMWWYRYKGKTVQQPKIEMVERLGKVKALVASGSSH